jgi:HD-GYP domain-containing protein (c-di-GMP phosphodiesterase class II)
MVAELAEAVETRHPWTRGHAQRVVGLAISAARTLGWDDEALWNVRAGSLLHDVGKLAVPAAVLAKPGPLTAAELAEVRRHPALGAVLVSSLPGARRALPSILHHHERWDGTGYPGGIAGEAIPAEARLVCIADAYDAMTSHRPYRATLSIRAALEELRVCSGTQFDPVIAQACIEAWSSRLRRAV